MNADIIIALISGGFMIGNVVVTALINAISNHKTKKAITDARQTEEIAALEVDMQAVKEGILNILRDNIIAMHARQIPEKHMPIYMREALEHSYKAYHALGGNGTITAIYNELMNLPIEISEEEQL